MSAGPDEQLDRARHVIADLRKRLIEAQAAGSDAVAVVGMACRFPGEATDCDGYWRMIANGGDAIRPIPPHRARDLAAGARPAALLEDIETFDAAFFDISPREADQMDPQQRLFLEVAWEALEDSGQTRSGLAGSQTGVFVGVHNHSAGYLELQTAEPSRLNEYTAIGAGHDVISGRLAYVFDLHGPSMAINTACSSSLVAVHMACQSLRARDCRMAVAGGVNLILGPVHSRVVGGGAMLAPDGRCKTFDARADGYGRGEGCGAVVLKRLSDAVADRDRVLAVIRGSAVNQDGRTNGLTAPNGLAQQALLRRTLARAGLEASRIGYIEAHGTGTALGDPIEVEALAAVYGAPADGASRCGLGSAKSNINHLEGAAGIAGLIRAILILRSRVIPPVAGFTQPNPHFSLDGTRLFIPAHAVEWRSVAPRVAAVSAFGWSGVNAHVLLEEADSAPPGVSRPAVIMVSAADPASLSARAEALAEVLRDQPDEMLESFAWTVTSRRSLYQFRLAVAGDTCVGMAEALRRAAQRDPLAVREAPPVTGFLIGGDAVTGAVLGGELLTSDASFRDAVMACAAAFEAAGDTATAAALKDPWGGFAAVPTHAAVLAFSAGAAAMLARWGIRPAAVTGWGIGAAAAAYLSGRMPLTEAVRGALRIDAEPAGEQAGSAALLASNGVDHIVRLDRLGGGEGSARSRLMRIVADLAAAGADIDWNEVFGAEARVVSLPAHRFRRRRHWVSGPETVPSAAVAHAPDDWFFETSWRPAPGPPDGQPRPRNWLILGEPDGPALSLASFVRGRGDVARVERVACSGAMGRGRWEVADLRALDHRSGPVAAEALRLARQAVDLDRTLDAVECEVRIWLVTRGAQSVTGAAPDLASAPLWGLVRSLILDHPERWGGFVDLDPEGTSDGGQLWAGQLWREIAAAGEADEIAFRAGVRYVNRMEPAPPPSETTLRLDPAATYLVTGAFGGIGPALAAWLAGRGAKSLVLAGRSLGENTGLPHPSQTLRGTLRAVGVEARIERCDVGDRDEVNALFARVRQAGLPLRGIFHAAAAGIEPVARIGDGDLTAAFRPKVDGALYLDEQARVCDLDLFVLFSSAAGVLGARGQGHYAAANAFLDALAAARLAVGLPALSIDWGLWGGNETPLTRYFRRVGLKPMAPGAAFDAMARLLPRQVRDRLGHRPLVAAMDGDRLRSALETRGRGAFFGALAPASAVRRSAASPELTESLRAAPATLRRGMLADAVAAAVRAVMELAPDDTLRVDRGFFDLGMDSLMTVALKERLEDMFGMNLPSTLAMDYPTVAALAGYFDTLVAGTGLDRIDPDALPPDASPPVEELSDEAVSDALAAELRALDLEPPE